MLRNGILNPHLLELLARFRHTNTLVIADRGFPFWPSVPTVDLSLVDDVPTVLDVLAPVLDACSVGRIRMATEFTEHNAARVQKRFAKAAGRIELDFEPHSSLKARVPDAIGLIRTADTIQYANMILESA